MSTPNTPAQKAPHSELTIRAFQDLIRDRYYATDKARGSAGTVVYLIEEFADVLAWLATIANITGVDLTQALAKYTEGGGVEGVKD